MLQLPRHLKKYKDETQIWDSLELSENFRTRAVSCRRKWVNTTGKVTESNLMGTSTVNCRPMTKVTAKINPWKRKSLHKSIGVPGVQTR